MSDWISMRREYLLQSIKHHKEKLSEYEKINITDLDDFNRNHLEEVKQSIKNMIKNYSEEIELIDNWNKSH